LENVVWVKKLPPARLHMLRGAYIYAVLASKKHGQHFLSKLHCNGRGLDIEPARLNMAQLVMARYANKSED
jgi:hypothetical protein